MKQVPRTRRVCVENRGAAKFTKDDESMTVVEFDGSQSLLNSTDGLWDGLIRKEFWTRVWNTEMLSLDYDSIAVAV